MWKTYSEYTDLKDKTMKKIILILFLTVIFYTLISCDPDWKMNPKVFKIHNLYTIFPVKDTFNLGDTIFLDINIPKKLDGYCYVNNGIKGIFYYLNVSYNNYRTVELEYPDINNEKALFLEEENNYLLNTYFIINDNFLLNNYHYVYMSPSIRISGNSLNCKRYSVEIYSTFTHNNSNKVKFYVKP